MDKCPFCYQPLGVWNHDPILIPNGAPYDWILDAELVYEPDITNRWYRGFYQIAVQDIMELQEFYKQSEIDVLPIGERTSFTEINQTGKFKITGQHIYELRTSVEKILEAIGSNKSEFFNYDMDGNHIIHPNGDKLDWTDPISDAIDLNRFQIKYLHIEDLRHPLLLMWEPFPDNDLSIDLSAVGTTTGDNNSGTIQKRQFLTVAANADIQFYNSTLYNSSSSASSSVNTSASCSTSAIADASKNGIVPVGYQVFGAEASSDGGLGSLITVKEDGTTNYPLAKQIWNEDTEAYDTYHLYIKAESSVAVSAVQQGYTSNPPPNWVFLGQGVVGEGKPQAAIDWENDTPTIPTEYATAGAEVILSVPNKYAIGSGFFVQYVHGAYHNATPTGGIVKNLNNFDIDLAQDVIDVYSADPMQLYLTGVNMALSSGATANVSSYRVGEAFSIPDPLVPNGLLWYGENPSAGWKANAQSSFTIDNIRLYYKKV